MYVLDLVVEDVAHEFFLTALVDRIAQEVGVSVRSRHRSTRGGSPAIRQELAAIRWALERQFGDPDLPDLLFVARDGDCRPRKEILSEIRKQVATQRIPNLVIALPDPHIERWMLLDRPTFRSVVGIDPGPAAHDCTPDHFKTLLRNRVREAGHTPIYDGLEFAKDIVETMDFYRAGRVDGSFAQCCDDLRAVLRLLRDASTR